MKWVVYFTQDHNQTQLQYREKCWQLLSVFCVSEPQAEFGQLERTRQALLGSFLHRQGCVHPLLAWVHLMPAAPLSGLWGCGAGVSN